MRARIRTVAMIRAIRVRRRTGIPAVPHKRPRLRVTCPDCDMLVIDVSPWGPPDKIEAAIDLAWLLGETHHTMCPWSPIQIGIHSD